MQSSRIPIDAAALRRMYVEEGMTLAEIAGRLGCSASTIIRCMRASAIPRRPRGPNLARLRDNRAACPAWSPAIAWTVGLIATDGNLANTRRQMSITSNDIDLLDAAGRCLGITRSPRRVKGGWGERGYRLQWGDRAFYDWLVGIGLTPRKSLTLGPLAVPDEYFADFFRGCIDGDGTVLVYTDRYHAAKKASYVYERLYLSLVSASRAFIDWIRLTLHRLLGVQGAVHEKRQRGRNPVWVVRYAKKESVRLLRWMYYARDVPCLGRKRLKAERFLPAGD